MTDGCGQPTKYQGGVQRPRAVSQLEKRMFLRHQGSMSGFQQSHPLDVQIRRRAPGSEKNTRDIRQNRAAGVHYEAGINPCNYVPALFRSRFNI